MVVDWPGINAVAVQKHLIPTNDPDAGPMQIGFAYFLLQDLLLMSMHQRVDHAARYMSVPNVEKYHETWINIIHSFLVIYTGC